MRYRLFLAKTALRQRCGPEDDYWLRWYQRLYFTLKCVLAVLVCNDDKEPEDWYRNKINVANFDFYKTESFDYGSGAEWTALYVYREGFGYFTLSDGYP